MSTSLAEKIPSPLQLRTELQDMVRRDLLGPAGGPEEILAERNVRGWYVAGLLAPKGQTALPEENDPLATDGAGDDEDGKPAAPIPQAASMLPSALGLTFTVAGETESLEITARWGRYTRIMVTRNVTAPAPQTASAETPDESPPEDSATDTYPAFQRLPVEGTRTFPLRAGKLSPWAPNPVQPDVYITGLVRHRENVWTITLFLVNAQAEPKTNQDEAWVFQPELHVRAPEHAPVFVKRTLPRDLQTDHPEDRAVEMLYRQKLEFAVGHGVAVHADLAPDRWDRAIALRTEILPTYEVAQMAPPSLEDLPELAGLVLDMGTLADTSPGAFAPALTPLVTAYAAWITAQETRLAAQPADLHPYATDATLALDACRETLARIRDGIALLDANPEAATAFRFANRAMALQRVHTLHSRAVRQGEKAPLETFDLPRNRSWRPFQLAFVLLNLPGLVDPTHPDRSHPTAAKADLLWFPTGGGKTEAYLGVAAFAMAIRPSERHVGGLVRRRGRDRPHALHLAPAHPATISTRHRPDLCHRNHPPGRRSAMGAGTLPHRPVGGPPQYPQLDGRSGRSRQTPAKHRLRVPGRQWHSRPTDQLPVVRRTAQSGPGYSGRNLCPGPRPHLAILQCPRLCFQPTQRPRRRPAHPGGRRRNLPPSAHPADRHRGQICPNALERGDPGPVRTGERLLPPTRLPHPRN
ncbi:MAG: hypothetical protein HUU38_22920 [Anaerolineales bacterium]|nr:hypothetical protein [Anaerolineales bacterium]